MAQFVKNGSQVLWFIRFAVTAFRFRRTDPGQDQQNVWVDYEVLANVSGPIRVIRSERARLTALISVCALGQRAVMLA